MNLRNAIFKATSIAVDPSSAGDEVQVPVLDCKELHAATLQYAGQPLIATDNQWGTGPEANVISSNHVAGR
jgi:hypothetical protein